MRQFPALRRPLWEGFVQPRLAWKHYAFSSARTTYGATLSGTTLDSLQRHVYYFGTWEPQVEIVIRQNLKPGDTFIDIGANVGFFSMLAANLVGSGGRVVSFEASTPMLKMLKTNVDRNGMSEIIRIVHVAVADKETILTLHAGPENHEGMASLLRHGDRGTEQVRAAPLGSLLTSEEISSARLIKIDVEGAEGLVLEGMEPILPRLYGADLLIEIDPTLNSAQAILERLTRHGWRGYQIQYKDLMEAYFHPPAKVQLIPLTSAPSKTMDVLFRRGAEPPA
jgi:FkbM family methyltransferase